ncbi:FAD-dependent oxidoreductase [Thioalkalivibrio sp.]|uniref:FAD-dependent oxidoreductase n=1 Tax=Thioalkalivibrio sp. TaxID=2093813 RepID=UPI0035630F2C
MAPRPPSPTLPPLPRQWQKGTDLKSVPEHHKEQHRLRGTPRGLQCAHATANQRGLTAMHVIVIGAGVTGTTTAWFLRDAGLSVTLLDAADLPAQGASAANGGMLHASHAEPWNAPGVGWDLLRHIGRADSPLLLRPRALPGLVPWGIEFLWNSRGGRFERNTLVNARLAEYSLRELRALQQELALDFDFAESGILKIFQDPQSLEKNRNASRRMADVGVHFEDWDAARVAAEEPALEPIAHRLCGALFFPGDAIGNAATFTRELTAVAERAGVRWRPNTTVTGWRRFQGRINGVETSRGPMAADAVVLASGFAAPGLLRRLGIRLPVAPVKGYSLTLHLNGASRLRLPIIDDANKVVLTPLGSRLRLAGTAEFTGADLRMNVSRAENVLAQCRRTLPWLPEHVDPDTMEPWAGLRPMSARGTPILGPTPVPGLYLNTGAGHLGWTFACGSAGLVRDSILGRTPALPLEPFLP